MKDEELEEAEDFEDAEEEEEAGDEPEGSEAPSDGGADGEVESSLEELIAKKEDRKPEEEAEEEETVLTPEREERLEPLSVKVVPPQATEFVCSNCHLVKHRSQLKDRNRMLCRDCA